MYVIDGGASATLSAIPRQSHQRHLVHDRQPGAEDGTYGWHVPASASASQRAQLWGQFVDRVLRDARGRGMSIDEVEERTGIGRSTIYRWRRAEIESPQHEQVEAFCEGLGVPVKTAAQILGWLGERQPTEPDPSVDPDLRAVMRRLNDPSVSKEEKITIRQMLRYLARGG